MSALIAAPLPPPSGRLVTAAEFVAMKHEPPIELVKGVVKEAGMPGGMHGKVCGTLLRLIGNHVEAADLGHVLGNDTYIQTGAGPDSVRGADVCFASYGRIPRGSMPRGTIPPPELTAEVKSPSDTWVELLTKMLEYLHCGVLAVIIIDPDRRTVSIYQQDGSQEILFEADTLTIPDVLPGFSVPVRRLFE